MIVSDYYTRVQCIKYCRTVVTEKYQDLKNYIQRKNRINVSFFFFFLRNCTPLTSISTLAKHKASKLEEAISMHFCCHPALRKLLPSIEYLIAHYSSNTNKKCFLLSEDDLLYQYHAFKFCYIKINLCLKIRYFIWKQQ